MHPKFIADKARFSQLLTPPTPKAVPGFKYVFQSSNPVIPNKPSNPVKKSLFKVFQ